MGGLTARMPMDGKSGEGSSEFLFSYRKDITTVKC